MALAAHGVTQDDPRLVSPLAALAGGVPEAPSWFTRALKRAPERQFLNLANARIETLAWGEPGRPGLLFLHGNGAHADWYSFIAPFFADRYRVASLSWSGMGASEWRQDYSFDLFVREACESLQALRLSDHAPPVVIGHSFGGKMLLRLAAEHGEQLAGAIVVDPPVFAPHRARDKVPRPEPARPHRIYPDLVSALARFRLAPMQPCENLFILDYIARHSLRQVQDETGARGWSWRFDPNLWRRLRFSDPAPLIRAAKCPVALIRGGISRLMRRDDADYMMELLPAGSPYIEVPEADHHVMLDQPLAFVAAIEALLTSWPAEYRR